MRVMGREAHPSGVYDSRSVPLPDRARRPPRFRLATAPHVAAQRRYGRRAADCRGLAPVARVVLVIAMRVDSLPTRDPVHRLVLLLGLHQSR